MTTHIPTPATIPITTMTTTTTTTEILLPLFFFYPHDKDGGPAEAQVQGQREARLEDRLWKKGGSGDADETDAPHKAQEVDRPFRLVGKENHEKGGVCCSR